MKDNKIYRTLKFNIEDKYIYMLTKIRENNLLTYKYLKVYKEIPKTETIFDFNFQMDLEAEKRLNYSLDTVMLEMCK